MSSDDGFDELSAGSNNRGDSNESEEIFALKSYAPQRPPRRLFKPWHKPRKQYVRQEQWGNEIDWLLRENPERSKPLRYLGLPGPDLLDIRYIYNRFCEYGQNRLTFLGFDDSVRPGSASPSALNISLHEVQGYEYVDSQSMVLGDNFRRLADIDSIAWSWAKRLGPFDVVNLDLCNYILSEDPSFDESIYTAIFQLCGLQDRNPDPWALFITSRIGKQNISPSVTKLLLKRLRHYVASCAGFSEIFSEHFGEFDYSDDAMAERDEESFFRIIAACIAAWILGLANKMRSNFSVSSMAGYQVDPQASSLDMISLVFRFRPTLHISSDPSGLACANPTSLDECEQAMQLPKAVADMVDIDRKLAEQPELWNEFMESMVELLANARYNIDEYRDWAQSVQIRP